VSESDQNLAGLLTPPGVGAIAVVRLHGPAVGTFLQSCFSKSAVANRCVHGELRDGETVIDDPVVVLAPDGRSVDLNLHGGTWVVQACLDLAQRHGFCVITDPSPPIPFSMLEGASELENEIFAYLPLATTETALRVLLAQSAAWRDLDAPGLTDGQREKLLTDRSLHWLLHPPRVAIVGIPNAGKSTLANQLFGSQRSITADLPGTTRDWVGEITNLDGLAVMLVDTPGIRGSDDEIEMQAIERAQEQVQTADAAVLVLDATRLDDPSQLALLKRFPDAILVLNKVDVIKPVAGDDSIQIIATIGAGIDAVRSAIRRRFQCEAIDLNTARCWTERQRKFVRGD
jgi:tRNA modification GTPase